MSRREYLTPAVNIIVLDHFFNLTKKPYFTADFNKM